MSPFDRALLAERTMAVGRHLRRVADRLPEAANDFQPLTDASDVVILHLWQATQIVIDIAIAACVSHDLGTPSTYADAFRRLGAAGVLDAHVADRLIRAAGFRMSSRTRMRRSTWLAFTTQRRTGQPICGPSCALRDRMPESAAE